MEKANAPGPWKPIRYQGYSSAYWTLSRSNPKWLGGTEIQMNAQFRPRRFKTEAAALAAIEKNQQP